MEVLTLTWDQAQFYRFLYILSNGYTAKIGPDTNSLTFVLTEARFGCNADWLLGIQCLRIWLAVEINGSWKRLFLPLLFSWMISYWRTERLILLSFLLFYGLMVGKYALRWLDWIFWGWYLPSLSINYVGMSKDIEKRLPQLSYYIKMKMSYDLGFIAIGVAMAT